MKAVIIGYGYMGQIRRRVVESLPELELVGLCDPYLTPEAIAAPCAYYQDYREAIDAACPDLVFVCTPNRYNPDVCIHALKRGCHVFCEKPPGRDLADIQSIATAEQASPGLKVMFGFNHRHHPAVQQAKTLVDSGKLGQILWLRGLYGKSGGQGRSFEQSWRNDPAQSGGGILLDQGIHMLDLFQFFCGPVQDVQGMLATQYWRIPVEDNAFVLLRHHRGPIAQLHSSATLWKHTFRLEIGLEAGYLTLQGLLSKSGSYGRETLTIGYKPDETEVVTAAGNPREEILYFDQDRSWEIQVQALLRCIREDLPVTDSSTQDALQVMAMIDAIYRQAGIDVTTGTMPRSPVSGA